MPLALVGGAAAAHDPSAGARRRHPAGRGVRADLGTASRRLAAVLGELGAPHPHVGAAAVTARGADGRSLERYAVAHGLDAAALAAIESGRVPLAEVPAPLRLLTPLGALALAVDPSR